jgi:RNA polymerase sigma-70 factor (ECF subfamily)
LEPANPADDRPLHDSDLRAELARLWLEAQPAVTGLIRAMVTNRADREDLIQSTAVAIARDFHQYEPDRSFTAWAVGVARYRVLSYYRDHKRDRHVFTEDMVKQLADAACNVAPRLSDREVALETCMQKLKPEQRRLLELRYAKDIEVSVIAERIGVAPNTLTVSLRRIRKALADCIERRITDRG